MRGSTRGKCCPRAAGVWRSGKRRCRVGARCSGGLLRLHAVTRGTGFPRVCVGRSGLRVARDAATCPIRLRPCIRIDGWLLWVAQRYHRLGEADICVTDIGGAPMDLKVAEEAGTRFMEGPPGQHIMRSIEDAGVVVEACFSNNVGAALLYAANLPEKFFDLSSGQAGAILQKLRNYRIRVAVVDRKSTRLNSSHL